MKIESDPLWSIVLAGGEGERTRAFVEDRLGDHRPKQYCVFTGTRSLFQHTVDRADALVRMSSPSSPERRVVVAAREHRGYVLDQLRGRGEGRVVLQPRNCGTAPGVFLALAYVLVREPDATVVIYPSDHFIYPESAFLTVVRNAVRIAERNPDGQVLLGVRPRTAESDFGWIVPSPGEADGPSRRVDAFVEKPTRRGAEEAFRRGGLWNTMILASKLAALWALGFRCVPEIMPGFERLLEALRAGCDDTLPTLLEEIYRGLPSRDFSSDVLERTPDRLRVLAMNGVWWNDWGRPERILETLRALERPAEFPGALALAPKETASMSKQEVGDAP